MANEKESVAKAPRGRTTRTPIGVRNRMGASNKDPNYEYRFVTDKDGRVEQMQEYGWELAVGNENVGVSRLSVPSAEGSVKSVHVGNGDKAILMRIPKEYYEEDQRAKQILINEKENQIVNKKEDGQYGSIKLETKRLG